VCLFSRPLSCPYSMQQAVNRRTLDLWRCGKCCCRGCNVGISERHLAETCSNATCREGATTFSRFGVMLTARRAQGWVGCMGLERAQLFANYPSRLFSAHKMPHYTGHTLASEYRSIHTSMYRYILSVPTYKCRNETESAACWCEPLVNKLATRPARAPCWFSPK
jgi:hypothetical protein